MEKQCPEKIRKIIFIAFAGLAIASCIGFCGCSLSDYSNESLFPQEIESVYVKMFDNRSFRRGIEYELTDALAKRIEAQAGYKIVSSLERADSVISGHIVDVTESTISTERETGRAMEKEVQLQATVSWKNLKTGELLIDNKTVTASATFSEWQRQSFQYASALAANNMARSIVELMEKDW
ncbi:MAG: LptE family protein [Planctomycetes bacterium]|nr:LptE family protein [Planctomycetota bacterium]MCK5473249.1 LptE family protein [Planctomycetota bacterium]